MLRVTKKRKKKHNKIIALAKSHLNIIDILLSSALNDYKISHEEITNIITEKNTYENIKQNIKDMTESSSLERIKEEEPRSLERTTLLKSFKILIILIKKKITCKALVPAALIKDEKRNLLFIM